MSEAAEFAATHGGPLGPPGGSPVTAAQRLDPDARMQELPPYAKTLLRITVPVIVSLAVKKQPLSEILQIGPGSILQFDKPCDEVLDLEVANRLVAQGEAVKIGDHFGLRITKIVLPEERFEAVIRKNDKC